MACSISPIADLQSIKFDNPTCFRYNFDLCIGTEHRFSKFSVCLKTIDFGLNHRTERT